MKYEKIAIGNRIGKPIPYMSVTNVMFRMLENLKWTMYSGPE